MVFIECFIYKNIKALRIGYGFMNPMQYSSNFNCILMVVSNVIKGRNPLNTVKQNIHILQIRIICFQINHYEVIPSIRGSKNISIMLPQEKCLNKIHDIIEKKNIEKNNLLLIRNIVVLLF